MTRDATGPVLELEAASLTFGSRTVWSDVDLTVMPGEFLAVLGPNGSGKTSLLRVLLGLQQLTSGRLSILGQPPGRGCCAIGYVPQQRLVDPITPIRPRDLVRMGIDGHRWGLSGLTHGRETRRRVDELLDAVGAAEYADVPVGLLSGGEQQRVRIAQALATDPAVLLCDEPLLSLDLGHQRQVVELINARRRSHDTAVIFVTHEINPVLPFVDRVLYVAPAGHTVGTPDDVLTSATLTRLYGTPVDALRVRDRIVIVGGYDETHHHVEGPPR
ncbi:MAG: metal ABC transporter ATP-binding protein [Cellulomonas sp.]